MPATLGHAHRKTYDAILAHPAPHNLHWEEVRSMLNAMAEVVEQPNGKLSVTRNHNVIVLHNSNHKDTGAQQIAELRAFLTRSAEVSPATDTKGANLLVVIDHHQARVYKTELHGTIPQRIVPHDPDGSGRYLHNVSSDANGQRKPEQRGYYDAIAQSLHGAQSVLIFGGGTGASSAMEHLIGELKVHHKDLAARVVGSIAIDEHHQTEDQLLAKAREYYAGLGDNWLAHV